MTTLARVVPWIILAVSGAACSSSDTGTGTGTSGAGGTGGNRVDAGSCGAGGADPDAAVPGDDVAPPDPDAAPPDPDAAPPGPADCRPSVASHPIEGALHQAICSPLTFATNPPSSGNHYGVWADFPRTYERVIPRGFWVHSLEHGAVVISYNCPGGCADEVAAAQAFLSTLPADCGAGGWAILVPDPELDVRFAASAWGWTLRADCFDRAAFSSFYAEHYNHGPESICGGGTDPTDVCGPSACP